jgi:hypothetical protein
MAVTYLDARNTTNAPKGRRQRVQVLFGMPASDAPI